MQLVERRACALEFPVKRPSVHARSVRPASSGARCPDHGREDAAGDLVGDGDRDLGEAGLAELGQVIGRAKDTRDRSDRRGGLRDVGRVVGDAHIPAGSDSEQLGFWPGRASPAAAA
ncbi:hypothetical protein ACR9E3_29745 [Actinomycetospora sp. C-140]